MGAAIYSWIKTGELKSEGSSITEGIGQGRVTANLEGAPIDDAYADPRCGDACPSSSICSNMRACASAARRASTSRAPSAWRKELGPGHTIVTILCDYGTRYQSKLFNPEFLRSKGLPVPGWLPNLATQSKCRT